jgi:hypothetical protein
MKAPPQVWSGALRSNVLRIRLLHLATFAALYPAPRRLERPSYRRLL